MHQNRGSQFLRQVHQHLVSSTVVRWHAEAAAGGVTLPRRGGNNSACDSRNCRRCWKSQELLAAVRSERARHTTLFKCPFGWHFTFKNHSIYYGVPIRKHHPRKYKSFKRISHQGNFYLCLCTISQMVFPSARCASSVDVSAPLL